MGQASTAVANNSFTLPYFTERGKYHPNTFSGNYRKFCFQAKNYAEELSIGGQLSRHGHFLSLCSIAILVILSSLSSPQINVHSFGSD